jgi:hypothetical protein
MAIILSFIANFYTYFHYSLLLDKVQLLEYQSKILQQNNQFLEYTIKKNLNITSQFEDFTFYFFVISFSFLVLMAIYNTYFAIKFLHKMDNYQTDILNISDVILKNTSIEHISNLSSRINEILIRQEKINEMLDFLTKSPYVIPSEAATNLATTLFEILK